MYCEAFIDFIIYLFVSNAVLLSHTCNCLLCQHKLVFYSVVAHVKFLCHFTVWKICTTTKLSNNDRPFQTIILSRLKNWNIASSFFLQFVEQAFKTLLWLPPSKLQSAKMQKSTLKTHLMIMISIPNIILSVIFETYQNFVLNHPEFIFLQTHAYILCYIAFDIILEVSYLGED